MKDKALQVRDKIWWLAAGLGLVGLYFATRLYHLTLLPVFCDEAIYIRWAQIMRAEPSLRFLPLQDGKQPLFMWVVMVALKFFSDPLFAGRLVSVLAGFANFLGVLTLGFLWRQRLKKFWWLPGLLWLFLPFALFFERMALVDALLSAFGIWSLIFAIWLGRTLRGDVAMILGMALGGALLTKSPGMFFVGLAPVVAVLNLRVTEETSSPAFYNTINYKKQVLLSLGKLISLLGVSLGLAFGIYNILRLGPNFHMIGIRNKDYVYSPTEILTHPLHPFLENAKSMIRYFWHYLTPPVFLLGVLGIGLGLLLVAKARGWEMLGLFAWGGVPLLVQAGVARVFTARYILFTVPPFVLFAAFGFEKVWEKIERWLSGEQIKRWMATGLLVLILTPGLSFNWWLWQNPAKAPLPADERRGYLEEWTAGWGIKEAAWFLKKVAKKEKVVVGTEGFFGTLPQGLEIYLEGTPNIIVVGVGYPIKGIPGSLSDAKRAGNKAYLLANESRIQLPKTTQKQLKLVAAWKKPGGDRLILLEVL